MFCLPVCLARTGQRHCGIPWDQSYGQLPMCVMGIEPRSFVQAAGAPNHRTISPTHFLLLQQQPRRPEEQGHRTGKFPLQKDWTSDLRKSGYEATKADKTHLWWGLAVRETEGKGLAKKAAINKPQRGPSQCLEVCLAPQGSVPHTSHGNNSTTSDQMLL